MIPPSPQTNTVHMPSFNFVLIALAAAFCAALTMFFNIRAGRSSWNEGPLALGAAFIGWWIGMTIFFRSFLVGSMLLRVTLWGAALVVVIVGFVAEESLSIKPNVPINPDGKPRGETTDSD